MKKNKISIIVPIYNVEPFIRKCVYSLINQTYENIEILLIDDGSPDNCGKICDALAKEDKRIKVIHQENKGLCGARNAGLKAATGDYIGFVDSDDWVSNDMFEYLIDNLLKYNADISACRYYRIIPNKKTSVKSDGITYIYTKEQAIHELVNKFTIRSIFCNKLFKKELFKKIKFPEGLTFEGTYMMHKLFSECEKIVFLPDAKYFYYSFEESIVNTKNVKNQCCYIISHIERYKDLYEDYPTLIKKMIKTIVKESLILLETCHKNKNEIESNIEHIKYIGNFIQENIKIISEQKYVNKVTLKKLEYYKTFNIKEINKAHLLRKYGKTYKKYRKILKKIKKKTINKLKSLINKMLNMPPKIKYKTFGIPLSELTNEDKQIFKKLHSCQLEILDELDRICKKNNLKYFIYGGTLLGAVRHKGFIPWDDDIDIVMPREDFEKLGECCKKELDKKFFYQTNKTDPLFPMLFAKIRMNNTYVKEAKWENVDLHQGIFIDILPLDLFPETSNIKTKIILEKFNVLNSVCQTGRCTSKHLISKIMYKIYDKLPNQKLQIKRNNFIKNLAKNNKTELICSFGSHYRPMKRRILKRKWFSDSVEIEFEGKKYPAPVGWKEYLIYLFGESYMELPPEENRINHFNFYDVNFNDSKPQKKK